MTEAPAAQAVTSADDVAPAPVAEAPGGRPAWLGHLLALALVLLVVGGLGDRQDSWTPDDGAYALQVHVLDETGQWAWDYPHADIDPQLRHVPFTHGLVTDEGEAYPYVKHPVWVQVLRASTWAFGDVHGLFVPSALGVLAAAMVAWRLAGRVDPSASPWAFWAVGLGPLLVQSTAMWAHAPAAALGGLCALWVHDAARGRRPPIALLSATCAGLVLLRTEGLFVVAATFVVLGLVSLARPAAPAARVGAALAATGPPAVIAVASLLVNRAWSAAIAPGAPMPGDTEASTVTYLDGRVSGAARSLIDGAGESSAGSTLALLALVAMVAGVVILARRPTTSGVVAGVAVSGVGLALLAHRTLEVAPYDLAGFAVASPLAVAALVLVRRGEVGRGGQAVLLWAGLFAVAVLATQYAEGGSRDWGGRFFLPLIVPAAVGTVLLARRIVAGVEGQAARRAVAVVAVALVVGPTALGLHATLGLRDLFGAMTERTAAPGTPVVIRSPDVLSRLAWREIPDGDWLAATERADIERLLRDLREKGAGAVTVSGPVADEIEAAGYERDERPDGVVVFTPLP